MSLRSVEARIGSELLVRGESTPPFSPLYRAAERIDNIPLETLLSASKKLDQPFLSWELIRRFGIVVGQQRVTLSTGFEGYLVGQVTSPEQMIESLVNTGVEIWRIILLRYKHDWKKRKQLRETITGEGFSHWAAREWSIIFEALLARKRASILTSSDALSFRQDTKRKVSGLSDVSYHVSETGEIRQKYELSQPREHVVRPNLAHLNEEQMFGLLIMQEIGKFGHPLVRTALNSYRI